MLEKKLYCDGICLLFNPLSANVEYTTKPSQVAVISVLICFTNEIHIIIHFISFLPSS